MGDHRGGVVVNLTQAPSPLTPPLGVLRLAFADERHPGVVEVKTGNPVLQAEPRLHQTQGKTVAGRHVAKTARNATLNCERFFEVKPSRRQKFKTA